METIRREPYLHHEAWGVWELETVLWKMVPVMAMLILFMGLHLLGTGLVPDHDSMQLVRYLHYAPDATSSLPFLSQ